MRGKLIGIGVGPGDPELMTLRGVRAIREADVIAIPSEEKENCVAYRIALGACPELAEKEILGISFPMTKDPQVLEQAHRTAAERVAAVLEQGKNITFLTLGDVTVYSTYLYLHHQMQERGYSSELVSGVPSFCAAAAALHVSLCEGSEALHILPGSYPLENALSLPGNKVIMKSGRQIGEVRRQLLQAGASAMMVENCGMEQQKIYRSTEEFPEQAGYYSLILVKE